MKQDMNIEREMKRLLANDNIDASPDSGIKERLQYAFMLKNCSQKVRQNSFASLFNSFFSINHIGLKTAAISLLLLFTILQPDDLKDNGTTNCLADTILVTIDEAKDTTLLFPSAKDSLSMILF